MSNNLSSCFGGGSPVKIRWNSSSFQSLATRLGRWKVTFLGKVPWVYSRTSSYLNREKYKPLDTSLPNSSLWNALKIECLYKIPWIQDLRLFGFSRAIPSSAFRTWHDRECDGNADLRGILNPHYIGEHSNGMQTFFCPWWIVQLIRPYRYLQQRLLVQTP